MENWLRYLAEQHRNSSSSQQQSTSEEEPNEAKEDRQRAAAPATSNNAMTADDSVERHANAHSQVNHYHSTVNSRASNATLQSQSGSTLSLDQLLLQLGAAQTNQQALQQSSNSQAISQSSLPAASITQDTGHDDQMLLQLLKQPGGKELVLAWLQTRQIELILAQLQAAPQVQQQQQQHPPWNQALAAQQQQAQQPALAMMEQLAIQQQLLALMGQQAFAQACATSEAVGATMTVTNANPSSNNLSGSASLDRQGTTRPPASEAQAAQMRVILPASALSLKPAASGEIAVQRDSQAIAGPSVLQATAPRGGRSHCGPEPFPEKLFRIMNESEGAGLEHIISFTDSGLAFRIYNADAFVAEIAPKYFRHRKLDSFRRQLNLYGFARVFRGPDQGAYMHECFRRDRPDLLYRIRSSSSKPAAKPKI